MPLRLIEMVLPEPQVGEAKELLQGHPVADVWYDRLSKTQVLVKILVEAEQSEALMDALDGHFAVADGFRLILLPVVASLPRVEVEPEQEAAKEAPPSPQEAQRQAERVSREELYGHVADTIKVSRVYYVMVLLSTVVAAIGLLQNSVAVVIGAMVIAPLLGPNMALALATTLGDKDLAKKALKVNLGGIAAALALSVIMGGVLNVDPTIPEIAMRTRLGMGDMVLALAAGSAGSLAFTAGAPAALIGVMVAVALLPPLVTMGLLLGSAQFVLAAGALWLLLTNIISINLAGVVTFWAQGIQPTTWWEATIARRATRISIISCGALLVVLVLLILFAKRMAAWPHL
jgi:uncharacterized hydrophobic protein (TIGR00341 family)